MNSSTLGGGRVSRRRIVAGVGGVTVALALAACGGSSTTTSSSSSPVDNGRMRTIAFVMGAESDPFFQAMKIGAESEAKAKNVKLIWQGDPKEYSPATQIPYVDQVLAQKPDGLVLIPTDPNALQASVTKAKAAGVVVANVDTHVADLKDVLTFITGDNADGGAKAADAMAKAMGYKDGQTYEVVVGMSSATATTNTARLEGFQKQVTAKYPGIKIVDKGYSQSKPAVANTNVNNWLTKYPNLKGIFAIDGTNADGAQAALAAKGLTGKIALVGYDAYPKNVKLMQSGHFAALIAQNPGEEAKMAIDSIIKYLDSKQTTGIEHEVVIPNIVLSKDTPAADIQKYTYPG